MDSPLLLNEVEIALYTPADLDGIMELENACFGDPWSRAAMEETLKLPVVNAWVARRAGQVVGFVIGYLLPPEGEIADLCVSPAERGRGIGQALLAKVMRDSDCARFFLEVRVSNAPAIGLYRKLGFVELGVRKRYYDHPKEDALVMEWSVADEKGE